MNDKMVMSYNEHDSVNMSVRDWGKDVSKHNKKYLELLQEIENGTQIFEENILVELINNDYDFWIYVRNDKPYYNKDCMLVSLYLRYINKDISVYINKSVIDKYNN